MIRALPDASFDRDRWLAILANHGVHAVILGIELILLDKVPLQLEGVEVHIGLTSIALVHQEQGVQTLELHPPFFGFAFRLAYGGAILIKAAQMFIPAVMKSMIDQHLGHAFGARVVAFAQHIFGFQHQVRCFHIVTVGIVVWKRLPRIREVQVHGAWINADFIANDDQKLLESLTKQIVFPDFVELREALQQMNVRVHGFVANREL